MDHPSCPQCRQIPSSVTIEANNEISTCAICLDDCTNDVAILSCCIHQYCAGCWNSYAKKKQKSYNQFDDFNYRTNINNINYINSLARIN